MPDKSETLAWARDSRTGLMTLMTPRHRAARDRFISEYVATLEPCGVVETDFAEDAAENAWRLKRDFPCVRDLPSEPNLFLPGLKAVETFMRYKQHVQKMVDSSLKTLKRMQEQRKKEALAAAPPRSWLDLKDDTDPPAQNGFVFSDRKTKTRKDTAGRQKRPKLLIH